jgi:two-component system, NtrC family, response regulator AtoC
MQDSAGSPLREQTGCDLLEPVAVRSRLGLAHLAPNPRPVAAETPAFGRFVGASAAMRTLYERIGRVAPTEVPVLLVGESGTGKELAARAIHEQSLRRDAPFIAVNAGAIPSSMVESEMFGHERGSFTGAVQRHIGYFERARGGTLLLDEITEMSIDLQVKLLRVLESDTLQRVGGEKEVPFDVRIIAATNMAPEQAIADGRLRKDLYYRLGVFRIDLPRLAERGRDLEVLARHFLRSLNEAGGTGKRFRDDAFAAVAGHPWPGNVRELKNLIHAAYIASDDDLVTLTLAGSREPHAAGHEGGAPQDGRDATDGGAALRIPVGTTAAEAEKRLILATLESCGGDKTKAARVLGLSLKTIYNRLKAFRDTPAPGSHVNGNGHGNGRVSFGA